MLHLLAGVTIQLSNLAKKHAIILTKIRIYLSLKLNLDFFVNVRENYIYFL